MKRLLIIGSLAVVGCEGTPRHAVDGRLSDRQKNLRAIPLPTTTPVDYDPGLRAVYLEWYWMGYYNGGTFCGLEHPLWKTQFAGYSAGSEAAMQDETISLDLGAVGRK